MAARTSRPRRRCARLARTARTTAAQIRYRSPISRAPLRRQTGRCARWECKSGWSVSRSTRCPRFGLRTMMSHSRLGRRCGRSCAGRTRTSRRLGRSIPARTSRRRSGVTRPLFASAIRGRSSSTSRSAQWAATAHACTTERLHSSATVRSSEAHAPSHTRSVTSSGLSTLCTLPSRGRARTRRTFPMSRAGARPCGPIPRTTGISPTASTQAHSRSGTRPTSRMRGIGSMAVRPRRCGPK